ncbi:DotA/TraY family protein [Pseudomonas sp. R76]|uniref:DotA/TraY family protein n=1 Tax=Pseudomonas sp. R76 TaxID=1573711 RepID=UPI0013205711|nr:DotA/TraY family protein [Pseudomonas sp. R76]QHD04547.1 conjugal transfer protein TraY [Pseudomonas sp. R76]
MKLSLRLLMLLAALSCGPALAADGPFQQFTPPPGDTSIDFLEEVFGSIVGTIHSGGNVQIGEAEDVMGSMMGVFGGAVLFLGMLLVGYTTIKGTIDSAHDGEVLGKKMSSIWIPLRTVGGTALLLPLGHGYSLIQIIVLWLAIQGVGIGDAIWSQAVDQMGRDGMLTRPMIPDSRPLAASILKFEVCAAAMNKQFAASGRSTRIQAVSSPRKVANTGELDVGLPDGVPVYGAVNMIQKYANASYTVIDYKWKANDSSYMNPDVCGALTWKQSWEASEGNSNTKIIKEPILAAHAKAVQQMILDIRPTAQQIVAGQKPEAGVLDSAANKYENSLRTAAKTAVSQTSDRARADFLSGAKDGGWLFAGTWYNHIVKMNDVMQSTLNALPAAEPIDIIDKETKESLQTYQDVITTADEYAKNRVESIRNVYYADTNIRAPRDGEGAWEYVKKMLSAPFMGAINQMTQSIAGSNLNHMSQMKSFGDVIVTTGEVMMTAMASAVGVSNSWAAQATVKVGFDAGAVFQFLSSLITVLLISLFFFGATLSTYVPMIPFITWITSVVNWFVLVLESVIAAPLFAVAHIHPDGDDAVGKAGQGYMMILSLVMRPALMLFGLIGGMLLTQPIVGFINVGFMSVVAGIQADSMTGIVSFVAYVAIYVIVMTTVVHIVFSLIHWVPDNIIRWIGHAAGGIGDAQSTGDSGHDVFIGGVREAKHGASGGLGGSGHKSLGPEGSGTPGPSGSNSPSNKDLLGSGPRPGD